MNNPPLAPFIGTQVPVDQPREPIHPRAGVQAREGPQHPPGGTVSETETETTITTAPRLTALVFPSAATVPRCPSAMRAPARVAPTWGDRGVLAGAALGATPAPGPGRGGYAHLKIDPRPQPGGGNSEMPQCSTELCPIWQGNIKVSRYQGIKVSRCHGGKYVGAF